MSIVALMQDAAEARRPQKPVRGRRAAVGLGEGRPAAPDTPANQVAAVATELTRYIPTEAIGLYTAALPFLVSDNTPLADQNYTSRWILVAIVAIIAVLYAVGIFKKEVEKRGERFRWPPKRTVTVLIAFGAWVMVIPGSPFQAFSWFSPSLGAVIGLVATAILSLITLWFGEAGA